MATRAGVALTLLTAGWWALRPLETPDLSLPPPPENDLGPAEASTLAALDDSAFRAPLWIAPPPPPEPAPEPPKPAPLPPLKLQLLAIVRTPATGSDHEYKALLYDPEVDKIVEVAAGQTIGERTVVGVTQHEITLKDRAGTRTLSLRPEGPGAGPGAGAGAGAGGGS
ncbi:MAG: hypothetical protein IT436_13525 [Phycisphaerales bacterium]|nr:hypothetical protein [Phycisphaerales bacterium]